MRNQRGNIQLVIVVIIVLVGLVVGVYLVKQRTNILPKAASPTQTYQPTYHQTIQTDEDLMKTSDNLDSENVDGIDSALNQNDNDLNTF